MNYSGTQYFMWCKWYGCTVGLQERWIQRHVCYDNEDLICIINAYTSYFPYGYWQGRHIGGTGSYRKGEYNDMCVMLMRALFA